MAKTRRHRHSKVRRTKSRRGGVPPSHIVNLSNPVGAVLHAKYRKMRPVPLEDDPLTTWWVKDPIYGSYTKYTQEPQYGVQKRFSNYARTLSGLPLHDPHRFDFKIPESSVLPTISKKPKTKKKK